MTETHDPASDDAARGESNAQGAPGDLVQGIRERGARRRRRLPLWLWVALLFSLVPTLGGALAWCVGGQIPEVHEVRVERTLAAPVDEVWDALVDVEAYPAWRDVLASVTLLDPGPPGPVWREVWVGSKNESITLQTIAAERSQRWEIRVIDTSESFGGTWVFTLTPEGNATRVELMERGAIPGNVARFVMHRMVPGGVAYYADLWLSSFEARFAASSPER